MRSKYEQETFAVYQGKIFTAYTRNDCFVRLRSYDVDDISKYGFTPVMGREIKGLKDVSPYEVMEYYEQKFEARYKGKHVFIDRGNDDTVDIIPDPAEISYEELKLLKFDIVGKSEYEKKVSTSELTDITCIKRDKLENAKEDYDEEHSEK